MSVVVLEAAGRSGAPPLVVGGTEHYPTLAFEADLGIDVLRERPSQLISAHARRMEKNEVILVFSRDACVGEFEQLAKFVRGNSAANVLFLGLAPELKASDHFLRLFTDTGQSVALVVEGDGGEQMRGGPGLQAFVRGTNSILADVRLCSSFRDGQS